jgi:hypothetical protein
MKKLNTFLLFGALIAYTFHLYSLRSDLVPWGSSRNDGLYFLVYYFVVLPLMLLVSFLKSKFYTLDDFYKKINFFIYAIIVSIPAIVSLRLQLFLNLGMLVCVLVLAAVVYEFIKVGVRNKVDG